VHNLPTAKVNSVMPVHGPLNPQVIATRQGPAPPFVLAHA